MRWLKTLSTLVLLTCWLPSTSHALLEQVGLIDEWHADHDHGSSGSHQHHSTDHDAAHGIVLAPSAKVRVPMPELLVPTGFLAIPVAAAPNEAPSSGLHPGRALPGAAPSFLPRPWHFAHRAALPIRAPSTLA